MFLLIFHFHKIQVIYSSDENMVIIWNKLMNYYGVFLFGFPPCTLSSIVSYNGEDNILCVALAEKEEEETSFLQSCSRFFTRPITITFSYVSTCVYINSLIQVLVQSRAKKYSESHVCGYSSTNDNIPPDLGFDFLPVVHWVGVLMHYHKILPTKCRYIIFRRWWLTLGTVFFLRGITIASTLLPNPYPQCKSTVKSENPFYEALPVFTQVKETCSDVLFSGDATNATVAG